MTILSKRNLPDAAYNCAMWGIVNRNSFFELRIGRIQGRDLLDQSGPGVVTEQRVTARKSFLNSKLSGVINTRSIVSSGADVSKFGKGPQQLLPLDSVSIQ